MEYLRSCISCGSDSIRGLDSNCSLCVCQRCGLIFDNPRPSYGEISAFYARKARNEDHSYLKESRFRANVKRLTFVEKYKTNGSILDIGAGSGDFLALAKSRFKVYGTEISDDAATIARNTHGVELNNLRIDQLRNRRIKFDVITLFHVLEHVQSPRDTMNVCRDLLLDDGILVVAVPYEFSGLRPLIVKLLKLLKVTPFKDYNKFGLPRLDLNGEIQEIHLSHFTPQSLEYLLRSSGFIILEVGPDMSYSARGFRKFLLDFTYTFSLIVYKLFHRNIFIATLVCAKRDPTFLSPKTLN